MGPVIFVDITSLGHIYTVKTEAVKFLGNLFPNLCDRRGRELRYTLDAGTIWNLDGKVDKARAVEDLLDRLLVLIFQWPDPCLSDALTVSEQGLLFAGTCCVQKSINGAKKSSNQPAAETAFGTVDRTYTGEVSFSNSKGKIHIHLPITLPSK